MSEYVKHRCRGMSREEAMKKITGEMRFVMVKSDELAVSTIYKQGTSKGMRAARKEAEEMKAAEEAKAAAEEHYVRPETSQSCGSKRPSSASSTRRGSLVPQADLTGGDQTINPEVGGHWGIVMQKSEDWNYNNVKKSQHVKVKAKEMTEFMWKNQSEAGRSWQQCNKNNALMGGNCVVCGVECSSTDHFGTQACVRKMYYDFEKYPMRPADGSEIENRWMLYPNLNGLHQVGAGVQLMLMWDHVKTEFRLQRMMSQVQGFQPIRAIERYGGALLVTPPPPPRTEMPTVAAPAIPRPTAAVPSRSTPVTAQIDSYLSAIHRSRQQQQQQQPNQRQAVLYVVPSTPSQAWAMAGDGQQAIRASGTSTEGRSFKTYRCYAGTIDDARDPNAAKVTVQVGGGPDCAGRMGYEFWYAKYAKNVVTFKEVRSQLFTGSLLDLQCPICDESFPLDSPSCAATHFLSTGHWQTTANKIQYKQDRSVEACEHHFSCNICVPGRPDLALNWNMYTGCPRVESREMRQRRLLLSSYMSRAEKYGETAKEVAAEIAAAKRWEDCTDVEQEDVMNFRAVADRFIDSNRMLEAFYESRSSIVGWPLVRHCRFASQRYVIRDQVTNKVLGQELPSR